MTTLTLAPLTDSEVFARARLADHILAADARDCWHDPGHYMHAAWLAHLDADRALAAARSQRLGLS